MNEKPPTSASLFLNEDSDKPERPERGLRHLRKVMQKRASGARDRMCSITRERARAFLRRNAFVLFTVAAVALGT